MKLNYSDAIMKGTLQFINCKQLIHNTLEDNIMNIPNKLHLNK